MKNRVSWFALVLALLMVLPGWSQQQVSVAQDSPAAAGPASGSASLRQVESTPERLVLELTVPAFAMEEIELQGRRYVSISASGLDNALVPRAPRLPRKTLLLGVPSTDGWSLRVLEAETRVVPLPYPVEPAPVPRPPNGGPSAVEAAPAAGSIVDVSIYGGDAFWPSGVVAAGTTAVLRDLPVARLSLNPFRFNPARSELEHVQRLVVEVRFDGPQTAKGPDPDRWDAVLRGTVANYDVARGWRGVRPAALGVTSNPPASMPGSFKIEIDADGLYQLTAAELQASGFPVATIDPANLHLWTGGQEVSTWVEGSGVGNLERLVFYGEAARTRYTGVNTYWLTHDSSPGLPMGTRDVSPLNGYAQAGMHRATVHREENLVYDPLVAEANGDHWYWTDLSFLQLECPGAGQEYTFEIPHLAGAVHTAGLRLGVQGTTFGGHNLEASINGHPVGSAIWSDLQRHEEELSFSSSWLTAGTNTLRLEHGNCPPLPPWERDSNGMLFSFFDVAYEAEHVAESDVLFFQGKTGQFRYDLDGFSAPGDVELYDITQPVHPERLTGGTSGPSLFSFEDDVAESHAYVAVDSDALASPKAVYEDAPSSLSSETNAVDYLLIGYGPFLPAAQPLIDLRNGQGLASLAIDIQDVYDEFSYGLMDPEAIRSLMAHTLSQPWQLAPTYVVLLGDGTIDYRDYLGQGWHNYVPAHLVPAEWALGGTALSETASDNQLGCVVGDDNLPEFQIGRLPAASLAQAEALVAKVVGYEDSPALGDWYRHLAFVADDPDGGGKFDEKSDALYGRYAWDSFLPGRIYLSQAPDQPHEYDAGSPGEVAAARAAVKDRFVDGQVVVSYFGHSSTSQWAVEVLLHRDHVPELQNRGRLPVVLDMTCYTASFQSYRYAPLDERLVTEPAGGAVATWGPTGEAYTEGHYYLAQGFLDTIFGDGLDKTLGAATAAGRADLYALGKEYEEFYFVMVDMYALLGDPATTVHLEMAEGAYSVFLPTILRGR